MKELKYAWALYTGNDCVDRDGTTDADKLHALFQDYKSMTEYAEKHFFYFPDRLSPTTRRIKRKLSNDYPHLEFLFYKIYELH